MRYYQYSTLYILLRWFVIYPQLPVIDCFSPSILSTSISTSTSTSTSFQFNTPSLINTNIPQQTHYHSNIINNIHPPSHTLLHHHPSDAYSSDDTLFSTSTEKIPLDILYENKLYQIYSVKGETILSALERARASPDPNTRIPLPPIPHDCRRGNCLTCSGRLLCQTSSSKSSNVLKHISSSSFTSPAAFAASAATSTAVDSSYDKIKRGEDGLNPGMSRDMEMAGFVLLCSSYVVEEGVRIEIGMKEEAWDLAYRGKLEGQEAQLMGVEASAKTIRQAAEKNVPKWIDQAEETLKRTSSM